MQVYFSGEAHYSGHVTSKRFLAVRKSFGLVYEQIFSKAVVRTFQSTIRRTVLIYKFFYKCFPPLLELSVEILKGIVM